MAKKLLRFEWDKGNVTHLWKRHSVRPFEAEEVMRDRHALVVPDELHSKRESRYAVVGRTRKNRTLFLAFTIRIGHIRALHARDAKRKEVALYEEEKVSIA